MVRFANRVRQRERPHEPTDLAFVVDDRHIPQGFLRADVMAGDRRHLIFATRQLLTLFANAKTSNMDGTFKLKLHTTYVVYLIKLLKFSIIFIDYTRSCDANIR